MEVLNECCAGLDVHKRTVVACLLRPGAAGQRRRELRTFGTMTADLLQLADCLAQAGCTHAAMESTGVFTPRTILPTLAGWGLRRRQHLDAEHYGDLVVLDLDALGAAHGHGG